MTYFIHLSNQSHPSYSFAMCDVRKAMCVSSGNVRKAMCVFAFLVLLFALLSHPCSASSGFVKEQTRALEKQVRKTFALPEIASKLSDLRTYKDWPADLNSDLKLYVGVTWFDQQHQEEAAAVLSQTKPNPVYQALWVYYQALGALYQNETDQAGAWIDELQKYQPQDVSFLMVKAIYLAQKNDLVGAIGLMNAIVKKDSRNGEAYLQRGFFNLMALSHDMALADFDRAIRLLPKENLYARQQALLQNGLLYVRFKGNAPKGMELINEGIALDPASELVKDLKLVTQ